jgi:uncharacterized membrane protein
VFQAMLGMQVTGTILYAGALAIVGRFPALSLDQAPLACALAALGLTGLLLFYKALALGPIAIVSPIGAAYVAVTLSRPKPGVWLAIAAMLAFGGWAALMAFATREHDGLAMILMQRIVSVAASLVILAALRRGLPGRISMATLGIVVGSGLFDTLANVFYVLGVQGGYASIVATGSGVYPIIPALLAITVLGERLAPNQYVGVLVLIVGLVGLGTAA